MSIRTKKIQHFILAVCCGWTSVTACGQSGTQPNHQVATNSSGSSKRPAQPLVAAPKQENSDPFTPRSKHVVRLPVALEGFCAVTLREQQAWTKGIASFQTVFDGQLYYFASQRERAMFVANPQRYVPTFAGNCVVTFAKTGQRERGSIRYGILHNKRMFFFHGQDQLEAFRNEPQTYSKVDLANDGRCLVSQIDAQKLLPGLPETTVIVHGLRYQFAGVHQQRLFLANMQRYGVTKQQLVRSDDALALMTESDNPSNAFSKSNSSNPGQSKSALDDFKNKAMSGYCPVSIRDKGIWVAGAEKFAFVFDDQKYLLAGAEELKKFSENPNQYVPALGGHCVVTEIDDKRLVLGSIYHAAWHEKNDRLDLYLFAGAEEKETFNANPDEYTSADLVAQGNCIVSLVDEGKRIAGLPDLEIWHKFKRYSFASKEQQDKFYANVERYQDP